VEIDFWRQRWADGRLGFHQARVNSRLTKFWRAFAAAERADATVLAPLCGKSLDMLWLARAGHRVIGVEVSDIACRDFFAENNLRYQVIDDARFVRYVGDGGDGNGGGDTPPRHPRVPLSGGDGDGDTHPRHPRSPLSGGGDVGDGEVAGGDGDAGDGEGEGDGDINPRHPRSRPPRHPRSPLSGGEGDGDAGDGGVGDGGGDGGGDGDGDDNTTVAIELWQGDWFDLTADDLRDVRLIYDRAALIALPQTMRGRYAAHLAKLLQPRAQVFLISMDYDARKMKGPPFSVPESEVRKLFAAHFTVDIITQSTGPDIVGNLAARGLDTLNEKVYRLRRL